MIQSGIVVVLCPRRGCHLVVFTGLVCLLDPESYAGGDLSSVGLTMPERLKGRGPTKRIHMPWGEAISEIDPFLMAVQDYF